MSRALQFCFDYVSPYAYLAWTQIGAIAARHHCTLEPVPVLFAGLLDAHGTRGPAEVPARRRYLIKDAVRKAHGFGVPIAVPFAHPFNPLLLLRLSSLPLPAPERIRLIDALFRAAWVEHRDVMDGDSVRAVVARAGLDPALIEQASGADIKQRVRAQTAAAIAAGVFGVPAVLVEGEMFWGTDALVDLERFLDGHDPLSPEMLATWESLPAAAQRPRSLPR